MPARLSSKHQCAATDHKKSGRPESNQGPSDCCRFLQSDALPTELQPGLSVRIHLPNNNTTQMLVQEDALCGACMFYEQYGNFIEAACCLVRRNFFNLRSTPCVSYMWRLVLLRWLIVASSSLLHNRRCGKLRIYSGPRRDVVYCSPAKALADKRIAGASRLLS